MFGRVERKLKHQIHEAVNSYYKDTLKETSPNKLHVNVLSKLIFQAFSLQKTPEKKRLKALILKKDQKTLFEMIENVLVSPKTPMAARVETLQGRQSIIERILSGYMPALSEVRRTPGLLGAVLWKKDVKVMGDAKALLQTLFDAMWDEVSHRTLSESKSFHLEMIIGDLLSLYPYLSPKEGEHLRVPLKINGDWQTFDYKVNKIELTPGFLGSPLTAYGLKSDGAPPLLLFKGTTYPTDKGFSLSLLTDINPFASVGAYAFKIGKKRLSKWLDEHTKDSKALVFGKSLGGALACKAAIVFHSKVSKAMTYGAPGFSFSEKNAMKRLQKKGLLPEINLFCQKNDPVPYFDLAAPEYINYYHLAGRAERKNVLAHADISSTHSESQLTKLNPSLHFRKGKRAALTALRLAASILFFPVMFPAHFAVTGLKNSVTKIGRLLRISGKKSQAVPQQKVKSVDQEIEDKEIEDKEALSKEAPSQKLRRFLEKNKQLTDKEILRVSYHATTQGGDTNLAMMYYLHLHLLINYKLLEEDFLKGNEFIVDSYKDCLEDYYKAREELLKDSDPVTLQCTLDIFNFHESAFHCFQEVLK